MYVLNEEVQQFTSKNITSTVRNMIEGKLAGQWDRRKKNGQKIGIPGHSAKRGHFFQNNIVPTKKLHSKFLVLFYKLFQNFDF